MVDLDQDGTIDIFPGEPLKMTDWHWFDWYNRPGVVTRESNTNCCAGSQGRPVAANKEEILDFAKTHENVKKYIDNKEIIKEIYVPKKIINFDVK